MARVFFSVGSNVDPEDNLRLAVRELDRRYGELTLSPVYRNRPVGFAGDDFLNMVVACDVDCDVAAVGEDIEVIHRLAGRQRGEERFAARSLDIDMLLYDDLVIAGPPVTLPRDDVLRYSFVLKPLADIAPDDRHPETGRTFAEHWRSMAGSRHGLQRVDIVFD